MDLASVVAALASVGVRVSGSTPNSSVQVDSSRACPTGLASPEPSGTINDPGQHFHGGTARRPVPRVPGGAAVPLRGCVGRRVRPVWRLVVRGVMGGVVWVGGGGRRCRAWGPVMGSLVPVAGGGIRGGVCRRGYRRQLAGAGCRVLCPWPGLGGGGGGRGWVVLGWRCWWCGGRGWVLCWLGVWASLWVVWVLRVCAVRPLRFLTG